ncbi:alpha/beta fold hydrolase [Mesonia sp. HuA40]|uniref:alpha/beta fold hydrolase n=1 Tax=Mesonia sp. HuA40 TaxID=2602761 RepID=UPI0011C8A76C|nr:alpha/beta fold hydrolase [Mesonia sp. HuA40]TXK73257.1 alpha/beta fold hydrolase [Mesonia sp. HuA40]
MKLHANIIGQGEPLLILHGFLGMGDNWKTLGKQFAEEGYQVHLIDQRNHGRSPHSEEFSYAILAKDIKNYCREHNLNKVVLMGHSMGGKTAMKTAVSYPELIKDLVVVDIAPRYYEPHHQTILEGLTMLADAKLTSRQDADKKLAEFIDDWGVRQFLLKNLFRKDNVLKLRVNLPVLKSKIENVGAALEEGELFEGSALFINGGNSNYVRSNDRDLIRKYFPSSQLVTIKDAGHWIHAEKPEVFYQAVLRYLNR